MAGPSDKVLLVKVTSFLACQYATYTSNGLVDLGGIGLNVISAKKLPVTVSVKFFAMCESEVNDITGKHQATLSFVGSDKSLGEAHGEFETTEEKRNGFFIVDFGLTFAAEGDYRINLAIDGREGASWPLSVQSAV
jgi:uncharacterized protein DUF6941